MNIFNKILFYIFFKIKYIFILALFNLITQVKKILIYFIILEKQNFIYQQLSLINSIRFIFNLIFVLICILTNSYYLLAISYFIYKLMTKFNKLDLFLSHFFFVFVLSLVILSKMHFITILDLFIIYFFFFFLIFLYKICYTLAMYQPHKSKNLALSWSDFDKIINQLNFLVFTFIVPLSTLYFYMSILIQYPYMLKCNANTGIFFNF